MSKKILVIGAGVGQVDAIEKAKELGYYVLASDGSSSAVGLKAAHEGRVIDVMGVEENLAWAKQEKVDGVTSYATDVALPTVVAIRGTLGLPGLDRIPMEISLDKSKQRKLFQEEGLPQPNFEIVGNAYDLRNAVKRVGFPLVIKPVDNAGSRGVMHVSEPEQLLPAYSIAVKNSKRGHVIIEEFMEGIEITVEGFSVNRSHHILAISDKFKPVGPYCVATQLAYPAAISPEQEQDVIELTKTAYDVAGVDNAPTHSEFFLTPEGAKIIEIGCRGGGFYVFTRVVEAASGYDIVSNWTRFCVGDPVDEVSIVKSGVVLRFYVATPGKLVRIKGLKEAQATRGVETDTFFNPGEEIPELKSDGTRSGWMIARGRDRDEAIMLADRVSEMVEFETEPL